MRLGNRTARRHETVGAQKVAGVRAEDYWEYAPGERVMTVDGYAGVVTAVLDGPVAGNEAYQVTLDAGMGGGQYVTGQLRPMHGGATASTQAATQHTADVDYPELSDILASRPDPALDQVLGRRVAFMQAQAIEYSPEIEESELVDPALKELDPQAVDPVVDHQFDHDSQPARTAAAGPYDLLVEAATDTDLRFHLTAAWRDVRAKAKRIRAGGGVHIKLAQGGIVMADVQGDTAIYETGIQRHPGRQAIAQYSCGCKWGSYHWGAEDDLSRFAGRMCSHALALQFEAQSRGMFGRSVYEDADTPAWLRQRRVVVKYDIDDRENITRAAALSEPPARVLVSAAAGRGEDLQALSVLLSVAGIHEAAVNNAWGEPVPNQVGYLPGPTTPHNPFENPCSAGPLSSADPKSWQQLRPQTRVKPSLDRMSVLHDEPEAALPSTDGADEGDPEAPAPRTAAVDDAMFEPVEAVLDQPAVDPEGPAEDEFLGVGSPHGATASLEDAQTPAEVLAAFQSTASHIMATPPAAGGEQDVATAAREHLAKSAAKEFTAAEQAALINEGAREGVRARNLDKLDIAGTHYAHIQDEDDEELWV